MSERLDVEQSKTRWSGHRVASCIFVWWSFPAILGLCGAPRWVWLSALFFGLVFVLCLAAIIDHLEAIREAQRRPTVRRAPRSTVKLPNVDDLT